MGEEGAADQMGSLSESTETLVTSVEALAVRELGVAQN